MVQTYFLGVDIGGTKTAIGLYDNMFIKFDSATIKTLPQNGCDNLIFRIGEAYRQLLEKNGIDKSCIVSAGAASPGPIDLKTGIIKFIPTMGFKNENLAMKLTKELGMPVYVEKDTNAAVLCESVFGSAKDKKVVTYITISTGIGCATAVDKQVIWGSSCSAGEFGHIVTRRNGIECPCGGYGCLEQYASGTGIEKRVEKTTGVKLSSKEIFQRATAGDEVCQDIVKSASEELGYAISMIYQFIDPDIIVLGGSVTKDFEVFKPYLLKTVNTYTQNIDGRKINICVSEFAGEQVMMGAAYFGAINK